MVSSPGNPKARFGASATRPRDSRDRLRAAETMPDGCWADHPLWLAKRSGEGKDQPGGLGSSQFPRQETVPGLYVLSR
jgi:poly(3-hydroxyalkanoate) synthetase